MKLTRKQLLKYNFVVKVRGRDYSKQVNKRWVRVPRIPHKEEKFRELLIGICLKDCCIAGFLMFLGHIEMEHWLKVGLPLFQKIGLD